MKKNNHDGEVSLTVAELVEAAKNGSKEAFGSLYEKTYRDEYYVALKYMKNQADAEDVLQDAYLKAYSRLQTLEDPEAFSSWLSMIVANTAKSALRKTQPLLFSDIATVSDDGEELPLPEVAEVRSEFCPEENMLEKDRQAMISELLESLTDEQRMCVMMYYLEELKVKDIAKALETNENTVKSRLFQARKALKDKAERMKKKGYVFSIAPLPLLIRLLLAEKAVTSTAVPAIGFAAGATAASAAAAGATAGTAASAAAGTGGLFAGIGGKIAAIVLGAALAGGAVFGGIKLLESKKQTAPTDAPSAEITEEATPDLGTEPETEESVSEEPATEEPDLYAEGEQLYAEFLNYLYDEFEAGWADKRDMYSDTIYDLLYSGWPGYEAAAALYDDIDYKTNVDFVDAPYGMGLGVSLEPYGTVPYDLVYLGTNKSGMRYGFLDFDDDGTPELILAPAGEGGDYWSIFTLKDGVPSGGGIGGVKSHPFTLRINEDKTLYRQGYTYQNKDVPTCLLIKWPSETVKKTNDPAETADWPGPMQLEFKTFDEYVPEASVETLRKV